MWRNYFVTAYRNLLRNKVYALLNIAGLALGIGCALVIYKVVDHEMSYDKFRPNYDRIFRVVSETQMSEGVEYDSGVPFPMPKAIRNDFEDIEEVVAVMSWEGLITLDNNEKFSDDEGGPAFVESAFIEMFGIEIIHGQRKGYLENPEEALISESLAQRFYNYNGSNPDDIIGRQLTLDNQTKFTISGIFKDQPGNTDFPFTLLLPYNSQKELNEFFQEDNWGWTMGRNHCYLLLSENQDVQRLESNFGPFMDKYREAEARQRLTVRLLPLSEEHFNLNYENFQDRIMRKDFLTALAMIGLFLIITGSVNFVNMATAQSMIRAKEVGIRKVMGGQRSQLIFQFLAETFIITLMALLISLGLAELFFVHLKDILGYRLSLGLLESIDTILVLTAILIVVTLLSGLYPSILMAGRSPVQALKSKSATSKMSSLKVRRGLVILQFSITQFLIFATLAVTSQMNYFQNAPLGFQKENIILFGLPENDAQKLELMRNKLMADADIVDVSFALGSPLSDNNATTDFRYPKSGSDERHITNFKPVDEHYVDFYELEVVAGRGIIQSDDSALVINETMVQKMGLTDPNDAVGERVNAWGSRPIVGVVKDFHTYSFHEGKIPTALFRMPQFFYQGQIKIAKGASFASLNENVAFLEEVWSETYPQYLFDYSFMDEYVNNQYESELRVSQLYQIFSALAIFIGCLGLYGLISFIANQKTKEIGIRKVLGASIGSILNIFSKELVILLGVAFILSTPLAYIVIRDWLDNFRYSIDIEVPMFVMAFGVTLSIALITTGYNSIRAAIANPV